MNLDTASKLSVSLEEYLDCVLNPTFVIEFLQPPLTNSLTSVLHANNAVKELCGIDQYNQSNSYLTIQQLIAQQDINAFCDWIHEIYRGTAANSIITHLNKWTITNIELVTTQQSEISLFSTDARVEWTSTVVKSSILVLTGTLMETVSEISKATINEGKKKELEPKEDDWRNDPKLVNLLSGGGAMGEYLRTYTWQDTCVG
ncbi:hypothetical protein K7432_006630, partial [Basidiobolus ranarum]